MIASNACAKLV